MSFIEKLSLLLLLDFFSIACIFRVTGWQSWCSQFDRVAVLLFVLYGVWTNRSLKVSKAYGETAGFELVLCVGGLAYECGQSGWIFWNFFFTIITFVKKFCVSFQECVYKLWRRLLTAWYCGTFIFSTEMFENIHN